MLKGFSIGNMDGLKILKDTSDRRGFYIGGDMLGTGSEIFGKSRNIEIGFVDWGKKFYALRCKNEADCDQSLNEWVLDNIYIHDFDISDTDSQGFYFGSTDPAGTTRKIMCNGKEMLYKPSPLGRIRIADGTVSNTGRPGIQLSGASEGLSEIWNVKVFNTGLQLDDAQGTGISLGGMTRAYVHDCEVDSTLSWGIASIGATYARIENNIVSNTGKNSKGTLPWPSNILTDTRTTKPFTTTTIIIKGNKLGSVGVNQKANIEIGDTAKSMNTDNIVENNTVDGKPAVVEVRDGVIINGGKPPVVVDPPPVVVPPPAKTIKKITIEYSDNSIEVKP